PVNPNPTLPKCPVEFFPEPFPINTGIPVNHHPIAFTEAFGQGFMTAMDYAFGNGKGGENIVSVRGAVPSLQGKQWLDGLPQRVRAGGRSAFLDACLVLIFISRMRHSSCLGELV